MQMYLGSVFVQGLTMTKVASDNLKPYSAAGGRASVHRRKASTA